MNLAQWDYKKHRDEFEALEEEMIPVRDLMETQLIPQWKKGNYANTQKTAGELLKRLSRTYTVLAQLVQTIYRDGKKGASDQRSSVFYGVCAVAVCAGSVFVGNIPVMVCTCGVSGGTLAYSVNSYYTLGDTLIKLETLWEDTTKMRKEIVKCCAQLDIAKMRAHAESSVPKECVEVAIYVAKRTNLLDAKLVNNFIDCIQELYKIYQKADWKTIRNIIPQEVRDLVLKVPTLGKNLPPLPREKNCVSCLYIYCTEPLISGSKGLRRHEEKCKQKEVGCSVWRCFYALCVGSIFVGNVPGGIACAGTALSGISLVSLTTTIQKLESLLHDMIILANEIEEYRTLLEQQPIY
ncbi:hypothetical protein OS493_004226 [Desmophyllum pertusum]|uniref:Uncharacterized protein n=1 Tax=Desmophyllum pertusum TaxID=174260 RepID=A0A9W9ZTQ7_9CNID|nr:hypothetical protein OS493_004226 [Desmophyllum pertusum]